MKDATYATFLDEIAIDRDVVRVAPAEDSVLRRYHKGINRGCEIAAPAGQKRGGADFAPALRLPELTKTYREYFAPARMRACEIGEYRSSRLSFLDLMRDDSTNTTKTFPSLAMVARAVEHVRVSGENVIIVCGTSGNKGTAIRAAVERACSLDLVRPQQLRVLMIVPEQSSRKLRSSALWRDRELRRLNPIVLYRGPDPAGVKAVGRAFRDAYWQELRERTNTRLWYSLDLDNYRTIDAARAFFEFENFRTNDAVGSPVFHVHSVSSAFGLIGHRFGRSLLEGVGACSPESAPGYLLVQHLATPDMVLHLHHGSFDRANIPRYVLDESSGKYVQRSSAAFPRVTDSPDEVLDPTFYTRQPATSPFVSAMIQKHGGGGLVVSKQECVDRYGVTRELLAAAGVELPASHSEIKEWSVVMALTGLLNAIDRGILPRQSHAIVHGSGFYTQAFTAIPASELATVDDNNAPGVMMDALR
jgi:hypothetical protein